MCVFVYTCMYVCVLFVHTFVSVYISWYVCVSLYIICAYICLYTHTFTTVKFNVLLRRVYIIFIFICTFSPAEICDATHRSPLIFINTLKLDLENSKWCKVGKM